MLEAYYFHST